MEGTKIMKLLEEALKRANFVVLDTETTGLGTHRLDEIIEISIIDPDANVLMNQRIKPMNPIPFDAIQIHGITNPDVKDCPPFPQVLPDIMKHLTGKDVIVYNALYDRKMLHQSTEINKIERIQWKELATWHCAMLAFSEVFGQWDSYRSSYRWQKLSTAANYYGIPTPAAHNSLADCLTTLAVVRRMFDEAD